MTAKTETEYIDDTCPACEDPIRVPLTGELIACSRVHCRGRLRWKEDDGHRLVTDAERVHLLKLRSDLAELDRWVQEAVPGAARVAKQIREQLMKLTGEKEGRGQP